MNYREYVCVKFVQLGSSLQYTEARDVMPLPDYLRPAKKFTSIEEEDSSYESEDYEVQYYKKKKKKPSHIHNTRIVPYGWYVLNINNPVKAFNLEFNIYIVSVKENLLTKFILTNFSGLHIFEYIILNFIQAHRTTSIITNN
jgi:hypothetical protein